MNLKNVQYLYLLFELNFQLIWKILWKINSTHKFELFFTINNNTFKIISFNNTLLFIESILLTLPNGVVNIIISSI